jgi:hypothetical protein
MQQTPIQELIKKLDKEIENNFMRDAPILTAGQQHPFKIIKAKAVSLLPTEQQYIQQHAEGFLEWFIKSDCEGFDGTYWIGSTLTPISELYTKYIEYINSLTT